MPFVQINLSAELDAAARKAISLSIHESLVEVFRVPGDDYFQTIFPLPADALLYPAAYVGVEHSHPYVAIQITCLEGRTVEMKQQLYRTIAEKIALSTPVKAQNVFIVILENGKANWSFGGGKAQMVNGDFEKYVVQAGASVGGGSTAAGG